LQFLRQKVALEFKMVPEEGGLS